MIRRLVGHLEAAQLEIRSALAVLLSEAPEDAPIIKVPLGATLDEARRLIVMENLASLGGNRSATAERLDISRRALNYWLKKERDLMRALDEDEGAGGPEVAP